MSEFYSYPPKICDIIENYQKDYIDKVKSGVCIENNNFFDNFMHELKEKYIEENISEEIYSLDIINIINEFYKVNKQVIWDNYCFDSEDIIEISYDDFLSVPTKDDFELLKKELDVDTLEDNLIDKVYSVLEGIKRFIPKNENDLIDYKNIIIYIIRFSILRKDAIKNISKDELADTGLNFINERYLTEQFINLLDKKHLKIIVKNTTFYSLKYFREYN
jgi:hypothetical protein